MIVDERRTPQLSMLGWEYQHGWPPGKSSPGQPKINLWGKGGSFRPKRTILWCGGYNGMLHGGGGDGRTLMSKKYGERRMKWKKNQEVRVEWDFLYNRLFHSIDQSNKF